MKKIYVKPVVGFDEIESEDLLRISNTSVTSGSGNGQEEPTPSGPNITEGEDLATKGFGGFIFDDEMDW